MMGGQSSSRKTTSQHRKCRAGFTVVETMIVLAITGLLFVSFASTVSGRQNKVRFQQSINTVKSQIEQVISETQSGYFPDTGNFNCMVVGPNIVFPSGGGVGTQGKRSNCVFLGKVLQFNNCNSETYKIHSIAGINNAANFDASSPTIVPALTDIKPFQYGLCTKSMSIASSSVGAVGFITYFTTEANMPKGSQVSQIIPIVGISIDNVNEALINARLRNNYVNRNPSGGVRICFVSGTSRQSGLITIGASSSSNSVKLEIKNNQDCA